ncbi:ketoacyl-ACP synthase III [Nocardia sp. NBC_00565]|uniref:3-oxoacyl-ACP synthase III family protein n=1 Tax=Nocardia sp. NBC_00565 TaxID=2975993 RepID=UPI002E8013EA|nr:ketoacyl-ACP synthase III [Nocardia sp. NBC_00565]WUC07606.1 ketoacyl-ACP synthase III [Nocardia sp. NBC_00565]
MTSITARRGRLARPVGIVGTGLHIPPRIVTNEELVEGLDTTDEWIRARTGIAERRFADPESATSDLAVEAAREALDAAGIPATALDAIIVATFTPDQPLPATSLTVKQALGASGAMPLDLTQGACAGGIYGLVVAAHLMQNPAFSNVLVIGADCASRATDPQDRTTRVFFGDAAGAVVLGAAPAGFGLLAWDTGDELSHAVGIPAGGSRLPFSEPVLHDRNHYLQMDGKAAWNAATGHLPQSIRAVAARAEVSLDEVRHFLLHQANFNILADVMKQLDIPADRVPLTVDRLGNTASASIFTVLHERMTDSIDHGDYLILSAIGAGYLWGSLCFRQHLSAD